MKLNLSAVGTLDQNEVQVELDYYETYPWLKKILKIQKTMAGMEKNKHLKPFISHSLDKLVEAFTGSRAAQNVTPTISDQSKSIEYISDRVSIGSNFTKKV